ncbi:MAG TPA: nickel pincer cofactor biosynthesis protein LarC [Pyrinomonadaceae bacterium]|nr:nickel pincer cofactor biosynthesis protein LarC [Pyrinomonadaceae bacterium]
MKTLYFDCFAGASGNMILGGLVSLGVEPADLLRKLRLLNTADFNVEFTNVDRSGISAVHATVNIPDETRHRHLADIEKIIDGSELSPTVKSQARAIFRRLAAAEAKVHGIEVEKVHFHEVGALDAIIDVVGSCIGFELLGIERFACSKIHVGSGFVEMAHGKFPVPPPAVMELLTGIPIFSTEIEGELMTPTGAAIISTVCSNYGRLPEMAVEQTGYGAGTREYSQFPNALRLILGTTADDLAEGREKVAVLETNLDDVAPQVLGFVMDRAFALGALDCWFTPIQMKKNRPATMLSVLCQSEKIDALTEMLYIETTTLGVRINEIVRDCLEREIVPVSTPYGAVDVKIARFRGKVVNAMPEYEQVKSISLEYDLAFRVVRDIVLAHLDPAAKAAAN